MVHNNGTMWETAPTIQSTNGHNMEKPQYKRCHLGSCLGHISQIPASKWLQPPDVLLCKLSKHPPAAPLMPISLSNNPNKQHIGTCPQGEHDWCSSRLPFQHARLSGSSCSSLTLQTNILAQTRHWKPCNLCPGLKCPQFVSTLKLVSLHECKHTISCDE